METPTDTPLCFNVSLIGANNFFPDILHKSPSNALYMSTPQFILEGFNKPYSCVEGAVYF
jgi:hypothetical protein